MPGHRRSKFMLLPRAGVPSSCLVSIHLSFQQKEVPASKSEWDANTASQGIVFSRWCLLCYFSASVRPLSPAQSLGQFGRTHFSEGTSQPSDCRALG